MTYERNGEQVRLVRHGQMRCQQRGIPHAAVVTVVDFGRRIRAGEGAYSYSMDKKRRHIARRAMGEAAYRQVADMLDIYVVVSGDGQIITVAHRIRKHRSR